MGYVELQYQLTQEGMTVEQVDYLESDARFSLALQVTAINLAIAGIKIIKQTIVSENNILGSSKENKNSKSKIFVSPDKYVGETATQIEAEFPGKVVSINKKVYRDDGFLLTDFDIELDNIIIQVKAGSGKKLTSQLIRTQSVTKK